MQHSIAAKYAARPAARFVSPSSRARERHLGLRASATFQAVTSRATVLRHADLGPLVSLRASWRAIRPARQLRALVGRPRPAVAMRWARTSRSAPDRRPGAAQAPWRG
jgi:hypothetical protein